ncbi:hypothetical protein THAOC_27867 [Thalassiosira oceanica]|uniref:Uncharacterized protein n=1 Tax=Thalassiosira oceanica TaxID=159749 RepID=K0RKJ2_THAOC|nr:hypothetical protein THAOC_27867 [Thalassiosira oceanica]|eukprot:EJK52824.1 hypothetical protein THAOC_27867 [Thalassiosira oceanica]
MCVGRGDQRSSDIESPRLDGVRKIRRHGLKAPESGELSPPTRVGKDGFLLYRLAVGTILAVKVSFLYGRRHNQEKKGPSRVTQPSYVSKTGVAGRPHLGVPGKITGSVGSADLPYIITAVGPYNCGVSSPPGELFGFGGTTMDFALLPEYFGGSSLTSTRGVCREAGR